MDGWKDQGVDARLLDLEGPVNDIEKAFEDIDAVIFTAGSGGATGDDKTLMVDLDGAVKTMEAAHAVAADRFILVSALQAHNREHWNEDLLPYYVAKHYADKELMRSERLDYCASGWLNRRARYREGGTCRELWAWHYRKRNMWS